MAKQQVSFGNEHELVQYLATSVICRGYWFYVCGRIPDQKDATSVDEKLIAKYAANLPRTTKWRRKKHGHANIRYLRLGQRFMIFATRGQHRFFEDEATNIRDIRQHPLRVGGYSVSFRRDGRDQSKRRVHVRIAEEPYRELLATFEHQATRLKTDTLAARLYAIPYRGYAPVRSQLCQVLRSVNRKRRWAGLSKLPRESLFLHRPTQLPSNSTGLAFRASIEAEGEQSARLR